MIFGFLGSKETWAHHYEGNNWLYSSFASKCYIQYLKQSKAKKQNKMKAFYFRSMQNHSVQSLFFSRIAAHF